MTPSNPHRFFPLVGPGPHVVPSRRLSQRARATPGRLRHTAGRLLALARRNARVG
jgi:hypothetical protein